MNDDLLKAYDQAWWDVVDACNVTEVGFDAAPHGLVEKWKEARAALTRRQIKFHRGYHTSRSEAGIHGPTLLFIVRDGGGAIVFPIHTGWYWNEKGNIFAERTIPSGNGISWHKPALPLPGERHECEFVDSGLCQSGQCIGFSHSDDVLNEFKLSGEDWLFEYLEELHREFIYDGPPATWPRPTRRLKYHQGKLIEENEA